VLFPVIRNFKGMQIAGVSVKDLFAAYEQQKSAKG
jgi:hypothetical protein